MIVGTVLQLPSVLLLALRLGALLSGNPGHLVALALGPFPTALFSASGDRVRVLSLLVPPAPSQGFYLESPVAGSDLKFALDPRGSP